MVAYPASRMLKLNSKQISAIVGSLLFIATLRYSTQRIRSMTPGDSLHDYDDLCAPKYVYLNDYVRVERTNEIRRAVELGERLRSQGLTAPAVAVYDFQVFPDKPVLFSVIGKGAASREALLEQALKDFDGTRREEQTEREFERDGARLLCTDFNRGRGMVSMSVACSFSQDGAAGYFVRLAGASLPMDVAPIGAAYKSFVTRAREKRWKCPDLAQYAKTLSKPETPESAKRDALAAIRSGRVSNLMEFFPPDSDQFFRQNIDDDLLDNARPGVPRRKGARAAGPLDRVVLVLGQEETRRKLTFIERDGRWFIDPDWALKEVQDFKARQMLNWSALELNGGSFQADSVAKRFSPGIATINLPYYEMFALPSADSRAVCLSMCSRSMELFMVRVDGKTHTYARGSEIPADCPTTALKKHWP